MSTATPPPRAIPLAPEPAAEPSWDAELVAALDATIPRYLRAMRQAIVEVEGTDRLTMSQLRCLQAIAATSGGAALTTILARQMGVAVPSMSAMIDGLVERGLVIRQPDPGNRRQVLLVMTDAGRDLLHRYEGLMHGRLHELISGLSDRQKTRLLAALGDLAAVLNGGGKAGRREGGEESL